MVNGTVFVVSRPNGGDPYTFSVTAENDVSSQDSNINARTVNISVAIGQPSVYCLSMCCLMICYAIEMCPS